MSAISFERLSESTVNSTSPNKWIDIGVAHRKAKAKGITSKAFADANNIRYDTLLKAMTKHKTLIDHAAHVDKLKDKPASKLTRKDREAILVNDFRSSLRAKVGNKGAAQNNKSEKWFKETLRQGVKGFNVTRPSPGKLYAYVYDAKFKDTLPFWDKYPLIICLGFKQTRQGDVLISGLNLHYIPPKARQQFLEDLLKQYASTARITNATKLKIDWSKVRGMTGADQMIKSYIPSRIKGSLVEIKPSDWANVVLMPLQQFVSNGKRHSASKVWK